MTDQISMSMKKDLHYFQRVLDYQIEQVTGARYPIVPHCLDELRVHTYCIRYNMIHKALQIFLRESYIPFIQHVGSCCNL